MNIAQIGGEFALIERLAGIIAVDQHEVIQGIGDDAAVLRVAPEPAAYLLVTTDAMVENSHFRRIWSTAEQIGEKAGESNISDIAAMGGKPDWMVVSLTLPPDLDVSWADGIYRGLARTCRRHGVAVVGGDTTQGPVMVIAITLLGHVDPSNLCLRSQARIGDHIFISGPLGASAAAKALLDRNQQTSAYLLDKHLAPRCRMDIACSIAPVVNAMIDISDGLAADLLHICRQSQVGAEIRAADIHFHPDVVEAARTLGYDPLTWALSGGEDYELLFTVSQDDLSDIHALGLTCTDVGTITSQAAGAVLIHNNGERTALSGGYDHFKD